MRTREVRPAKIRMIALLYKFLYTTVSCIFAHYFSGEQEGEASNPSNENGVAPGCGYESDTKTKARICREWRIWAASTANFQTKPI